MKNCQIASPCHWVKWLICPASGGLVQIKSPPKPPRKTDNIWKKICAETSEAGRFRGPRRGKQKGWLQGDSPRPGPRPLSLAGPWGAEPAPSRKGTVGTKLQVRTHRREGTLVKVLHEEGQTGNTPDLTNLSAVSPGSAPDGLGSRPY